MHPIADVVGWSPTDQIDMSGLNRNEPCTGGGRTVGSDATTPTRSGPHRYMRTRSQASGRHLAGSCWRRCPPGSPGR